MSKEKINEIKEKTAEVKGISFHSIVEQYQRIAWELENGEFTDEMQEALLANEKDAEQKLLGMYYVIQMNSAKIDNFYKLEIENSQAKIKRLNKANGILKDNCMLIAEMYGKQNKYTSLELNCSKVAKEKLDIDEVVYETRVLEIKDIINGMREDDSTVDEFNCFSTSFNINGLDISDASKLKKLLDENFPNKEISFNPSIDKKSALEIMKANELLLAVEAKKTEVLDFDGEQHPSEFGLKGCSLGYTYYPRFS